jgi:hypothetical protein
MIVLFTDFGLQGPYTGQMKAVLHQMAPGISIIDLFADAPAGNPKASAYLLAAYAQWFAAGTTFLCVVDPGVGGARPPVILEADGRWYVGPGNGLLELIERRAATARSWDIDLKPRRLSASFHGRDLFAPVAAILARGEPPPGQPRKDDADRRRDWPDDLPEIVYVDHFGNALTGLRAATLAPNAKLAAAGRVLERARTFGDRPPGAPFCTRIRTGLPRSRSTRVARTAILGLQSAVRSKSSLSSSVELRPDPLAGPGGEAPGDSKSAFTRVHSPYLKGVYARLRGLWTGVNALNDALCIAAADPRRVAPTRLDPALSL